MCSRQSVLCPGWLSPNCNPATCRVFDPLSTWVQKINLDDTPRRSCTLKTADAVFFLYMDRNLQISPEWTFWPITAFCLYQWNQSIKSTSYILKALHVLQVWPHKSFLLEAWHTTGIPPCLRLWQAWRFNSKRMALSSMFLLIGGGLRGAGSMRTQGRCFSMANEIKLGNYSAKLAQRRQGAGGRLQLSPGVGFMQLSHVCTSTKKNNLILFDKLLGTVVTSDKKEYSLKQSHMKRKFADYEKRFLLLIKTGNSHLFFWKKVLLKYITVVKLKKRKKRV